jgi:hypothetical protein
MPALYAADVPACAGQPEGLASSSRSFASLGEHLPTNTQGLALVGRRLLNEATRLAADANHLPRVAGPPAIEESRPSPEGHGRIRRAARGSGTRLPGDRGRARPAPRLSRTPPLRQLRVKVRHRRRPLARADARGIPWRPRPALPRRGHRQRRPPARHPAPAAASRPRDMI